MFEAAPINTDKNSALLPSEAVCFLKSFHDQTTTLRIPRGMMDPEAIRTVMPFQCANCLPDLDNAEIG